MDAKIFVHCWRGSKANAAVEKLVQMGFTNLYAAGPVGSAGFLNWEGDVDTDDVYQPDRMIPQCAKACD